MRLFAKPLIDEVLKSIQSLFLCWVDTRAYPNSNSGDEIALMYQSFSSSIMLFDYRADHCLEYNGCSCNWRCYGAQRPRQSREVLREYKEFRFWKDFRAISCQRLFSCPFAAYRQRRGREDARDFLNQAGDQRKAMAKVSKSVTDGLLGIMDPSQEAPQEQA